MFAARRFSRGCGMLGRTSTTAGAGGLLFGFALRFFNRCSPIPGATQSRMVWPGWRQNPHLRPFCTGCTHGRGGGGGRGCGGGRDGTTSGIAITLGAGAVRWRLAAELGAVCGCVDFG